MMGWLLLIGFLGLALTTNPWWWIAAVLIGAWKAQRWYSVWMGAWKAQRWYFYKGRPWRRIHYLMMRAYAGIAGAESGEAERQSREFDMKRALNALVRAARPNWTEERIDAFINREYSRCQDFGDARLLEQHIKTKNKEVSGQQLTEIVQELRNAFNPSDKGIMVRMVIAGIIEEQYGETHRGEYLFEVLMGNAK